MNTFHYKTFYDYNAFEHYIKYDMKKGYAYKITLPYHYDKVYIKEYLLLPVAERLGIKPKYIQIRNHPDAGEKSIFLTWYKIKNPHK